MEAQTLFDTVAKHLLAQGKRAVVADGSTCRYRADDGCKCAIGALIPDELYDESMEGVGIARMLEDLYDLDMPQPLAMFVKNELEPHIHLLMALQSLHDGYPVERWTEQLCYVAGRFKLNPEVLQ